MASVYRPHYTRSLPPTATTSTTSKGETVARWKGRGGEILEGLILPNGRVRIRSAVYLIEYKDHTGALVRVPGFKDKAASKSLGAELERKAARVRAGLEAPTQTDGTGDTLAELADVYRDHLKAKDRSAYHVKETRRRLGILFAAAKIGNLRPGAVDGHRAADALLAERKKHDWSARTYNLYATAARAFGRWLMKRLKLAGNPFEPIEKLNAEAGRVLTRRTLPVGDLRKLFEAARSGPVRYGMVGRDRECLYRLAAYTGLRISELASLTPESFVWEQGKCLGVKITAADAKDRCAETLPIPSAVSELVGTWLLGRKAGEPVFRGWNDWSTRGARMIEEDLAAAGLPYRDAAGEVFDFHALRAQYITMLAQAGVSLAEAQKLARHSTPNLTANTYTKVKPHLRDAADKLRA